MKTPPSDRLTRSASENHLDFFPFGVQYHRAPTPLPSEWEGDMEEIARAGYTHIQLRPQWRWHERIRGERTWDDLDQLFALAGKKGLRVILKPMLETAPDWVFSDHNGSRIGFHGVPLSPIAHGAYYIGGWWPCFDNPGVRTAATDFVAALTVRYRHHPALWFYDAWNEPVSRPMGQCQCAHSQQSYRDWLRERFGTIEALNAWAGKAWTSFEHLQPPASAADYLEMFLWRQWAGQAVADQVDFVARAIREQDPDAFIMAHAGSPSIAQDPICTTSDDLLNSRCVDRYGTSFGIPHHPRSPLDHTAPDFQSDWLRRVDPAYWCHEFYPRRDSWKTPPQPETLARLIWMAIAGGAAGLTFWQYRSERVGCETNGYGIREIDGTSNPGSREIENIAAILKEHGSALVGSRREPSSIGMLHSRESDMVARLQTLPSTPYSIANEGPSDAYFYKDAIKSAHALHLMEGNTLEWVVPGDDLSAFDFLHITGAEMIDPSLAGDLTEFVTHGGTLLVEFPFACRDANTWVSPQRPGHGLEQLLGCREGERTIAEEGERVVFWETHSLVPAGWKTVLHPTDDAEVFARWKDGSPAAVSATFGKGRVLSLGINLSLSFTNRWNDPVRAVFRRILTEWNGLQNPSLPDGIWRRVRRGSENEVCFVFNVSDRAVAFPHEASARTLASEGADATASGINLAAGGYWVGVLEEEPQRIRSLVPVPVGQM